MNRSKYLPSKAQVYHTIGFVFRVYVGLLLLTSIYSIFWLLEIAGYLDEQMLTAIWIAIAAMGVVFVVLLAPLYYSSRSKKR